MPYLSIPPGAGSRSKTVTSWPGGGGSRGHLRRAGADHGRRPVRLLLERDRRVEVVVEHRLDDHVAGVAVGVADRDRLVDLVAPAVLSHGAQTRPGPTGRGWSA